MIALPFLDYLYGFKDHKMNYTMLHDQLLQICEEAAKFIKEEINKVKSSDIQEKELNSLVTYVDKTAEEMIVSRLQVLTPNAGFITEEKTIETQNKLFKWIIDPLDGTNNFLHKIPHFAISVALMVDDQIMIGVVHDVMKNEVFHAIKSKGAYLNHERISVSKVDSIEEAFLATGFPYANDYDIPKIVNTLVYWLHHARGVRRYGAASLDLAYVAAGRLDAYYESVLNIWDVAAGILLIQEAGGRATDFYGGNTHITGKEILVSNGLIHQKIMTVLGRN